MPFRFEGQTYLPERKIPSFRKSEKSPSPLSLSSTVFSLAEFRFLLLFFGTGLRKRKKKYSHSLAFAFVAMFWLSALNQSALPLPTCLPNVTSYLVRINLRVLPSFRMDLGFSAVAVVVGFVFVVFRRIREKIHHRAADYYSVVCQWQRAENSSPQSLSRRVFFEFRGTIRPRHLVSQPAPIPTGERKELFNYLLRRCPLRGERETWENYLYSIIHTF